MPPKVKARLTVSHTWWNCSMRCMCSLPLLQVSQVAHQCLTPQVFRLSDTNKAKRRHWHKHVMDWYVSKTAWLLMRNAWTSAGFLPCFALAARACSQAILAFLRSIVGTWARDARVNMRLYVARTSSSEEVLLTSLWTFRRDARANKAVTSARLASCGTDVMGKSEMRRLAVCDCCLRGGTQKCVECFSSNIWLKFIMLTCGLKRSFDWTWGLRGYPCDCLQMMRPKLSMFMRTELCISETANQERVAHSWKFSRYFAIKTSICRKGQTSRTVAVWRSRSSWKCSLGTPGVIWNGTGMLLVMKAKQARAGWSASHRKKTFSQLGLWRKLSTNWKVSSSQDLIEALQLQWNTQTKLFSLWNVLCHRPPQNDANGLTSWECELVD